MITVTIQRLNRVDELFCHYAGEQGPQECYVVLALQSGVLTARYDPRTGSGHLQESVSDCNELWVGMPCLTAAAANALLEEVAPLAQRIVGGATMAWSGGPWSGWLNADGAEALELLAQRCAPDREDWYGVTVEGRDARDWFLQDLTRAQVRDVLGITAGRTDADLDALAAGEEECARSRDSGPVVLWGTVEFLVGLREDARREPTVS